MFPYKVLVYMSVSSQYARPAARQFSFETHEAAKAALAFFTSQSSCRATLIIDKPADARNR